MLLLTLILISVLKRGIGINEVHFVKGDICDVQERLSQGCSEEKAKVLSLFHCVIRCSLNASCHGASIDSEKTCFFHKLCPITIRGCGVVSSGHEYLSKKCVHGTWHPSSSSCVCEGAYHGERCDKYPKTCRILIDAGYPDGIHDSYIDPLETGYPIRVVCNIIGPSYSSAIMMRNQGNIDFNKTMADYEHGFFEDMFNFWMGFETWRTLSQAGHNTTFALNFGGYFMGLSLERFYYGLNIGSKSDMFRVSFVDTDVNVPYLLESSSLAFGDCLGPIEGVPFSTWDSDSDEDNYRNCASRAGSGWWYTSCHNECNMLGKGFTDRSSVPSHQQFSVPGVSISTLTWATSIDFLEISLHE